MGDAQLGGRAPPPRSRYQIQQYGKREVPIPCALVSSAARGAVGEPGRPVSDLGNRRPAITGYQSLLPMSGDGGSRRHFAAPP